MDFVNEMTVAQYEIGGKPAGIYVDPVSDTEVVYIQSPPSFGETKINPRPVVILFSAGQITPEAPCVEVLKSIAEKEKLFILCPASFDEDLLVAAVDWLQSNARTLNIAANDVRTAYTAGSDEAARAFREMAQEEFEQEFQDAGKFDL